MGGTTTKQKPFEKIVTKFEQTQVDTLDDV